MNFIKDIVSFILRLIGSSILGVISWFIYFLGFDVSFFMSFIYAILTGAITFWAMRYFLKWRHIRSSRLPYRE